MEIFEISKKHKIKPVINNGKWIIVHSYGRIFQQINTMSLLMKDNISPNHNFLLERIKYTICDLLIKMTHHDASMAFCV